MTTTTHLFAALGVALTLGACNNDQLRDRFGRQDAPDAANEDLQDLDHPDPDRAYVPGDPVEDRLDELIDEADDGIAQRGRDRYERLYIGRYAERGACDTAADVWELTDRAIRHGDMACRIAGVTERDDTLVVETDGCKAHGQRSRGLTFDLVLDDVDTLTIDNDRGGADGLVRCDVR
ncbi:MAG: hypothetical protein R3F59_12290 [Myxococcota bacterium]